MARALRPQATTRSGGHALHRAEQGRLLLGEDADTGTRRGELSALHLDDLHGRVLHIDGGVSDEVVTTTKTGRTRRVTVGASTAALGGTTVAGWHQRNPDGLHMGPWLFSAELDHARRLRAGTLGHWFAAFVCGKRGHRRGRRGSRRA